MKKTIKKYLITFTLVALILFTFSSVKSANGGSLLLADSTGLMTMDSFALGQNSVDNDYLFTVKGNLAANALVVNSIRAGNITANTLQVSSEPAELSIDIGDGNGSLCTDGSQQLIVCS